MLTSELKAEIFRLFFAEHYTMNSIADTLGVHHDTVQSAINLRGQSRCLRPMRESMLRPYISVIEDRLAETPKLRSTRLIQILRDYGYQGSISLLRLKVAELRPKYKRAFESITYFPAEQAQVDWASFGTIRVGRGERKMSCFVMTLCYSRATYAVFTYDQTLESFLRGHIRAFRYFRGIPRILLYDNLKAAVVDRQGTQVRFNPTLLEMAGHYCFHPRACNVRSGWEKGRVERTIRYIRDNFLAARQFRDIDDANGQLSAWLDGVCNVRLWPGDRSKTVRAMWDEERERLLPLPENDFATEDVGPCRPSKICYVRYDGNDYSVPFQYVGEILTLIAGEHEIRIIDGSRELAHHVRSYSKGERIRNDAHFIGIHEQKPRAASTSRRADLIAQIPQAERLYEMMFDSGITTGLQTTKLFKMLEVYGKDALAVAISEAIARNMARASAVAQILERRDGKRRDPVPLPVILPNHSIAGATTVSPHSLATYDAISASNKGAEACQLN